MKTTSIYTVISRILRATGDTIRLDRIDYIIEFIGEALAKLCVPYDLSTTSDEIMVKDHILELPCGFLHLIAVEKDGLRVPLGGDVTDLKNQTTIYHKAIEVPGTDMFNTTADVLPRDMTQTIIKPTTSPYYVHRFNTLQFSFDKGLVKIHYSKLETDDEGYPLIPDNENLLSAIEWYVIGRLLLTGWKHPANVGYSEALERFEMIYAPRAINEMKSWTPENAERLFNDTVRLILPTHFYGDFGIGSEKKQEINTHGFNWNKPR